MDKTTLGDRMKNNYENISRYYLTRRMPIIIRIDGKSFHTFTKCFKKPFDDILVKTMQDTMKYLCENIQGCVLGYTQSDEISLVLVDYAELTTDAWFGNNLQKMCSVSASMATLAFNKAFTRNISKQSKRFYTEYLEEKDASYIETLEIAMNKGAMFDSRVFTIPKEEVCNYMLWRQQDATRNSILSVGQANFSHKDLHGKSCNNIQDMLMTQKGINWNDCATTLKRGSCCIKVDDGLAQYDEAGNICGYTQRSQWIIDNEIPIFSQDRNYIERLINVGG
jgi:tRNA(His) guanylyltransferase|nr:MAG TPA: tRNAHis guanylyltransferase [Bacteriophage sp.]